MDDLVDDTKCIVWGCENHKHEGRFVGSLCNPCHEMLVTGEIGPSSAFFASEISRLRGEVERLTANNAQYKAALDEWSEQTVAGNKQYEKAITETAIAEARAATLRTTNERLERALVTIAERKDYQLPSAQIIARYALTATQEKNDGIHG